MSHELKPCPNTACMNPAVVQKHEFVSCRKCYTCGPKGDPLGELWNALPRVPEPTQHDQDVEALARDMLLARASIPNSATPFADCFSDAEGFIRHRNARRLKRATTNSAETDISKGQ